MSHPALPPHLTKLLVASALACILFISCKRDKLVESSVKGRPVWVYGIKPNYVIAEGKGRTHDEARNDAFMNVKESIVNSISVNVSSTVQMEISERVIDNLWQYKENTKVNTTVSSYSLGFEYPQHFSNLFKSKTGLSPSEYRNLN